MKPAPLAHIPSLGLISLGALIVIAAPHLDLEKLHPHCVSSKNVVIY